MPATSPQRSVALVTLGCARNEVDSEELAGRLDAAGWALETDAGRADVVLVNTCGFVEAAKKDSVDALLEAADLAGGSGRRAVVAVGCLAQRYGRELAEALPEADAVLGFDDYPDISARLHAVLAGAHHEPHVPVDRRTLLPLRPVERRGGSPAPAGTPLPTSASMPPAPLRRRLGGGPVAPLKLASGCDRRCTFCAIPTFRGSYLSRRPHEILDEARWLAAEGVRELVLVSENSTSYGKDLGNLRLLEALVPELAAMAGIARVRVSYLQPAELRPGLVDVLTGTAGVAPYFDLSFQHASAPVLRRMRRFGDRERFLDLLTAVRERCPTAGARSNVIVGFPGETEKDVGELERFLVAARLDAVGVFGYSDEDGTEAAGYAEKVPEETVRARVERLTRLVEELTAQRAEERAGERVEVLVEEVAADGSAEGRAAHQGPEVDGTTTLRPGAGGPPAVGEVVWARVVAALGVDLIAERV